MNSTRIKLNRDHEGRVRSVSTFLTSQELKERLDSLDAEKRRTTELFLASLKTGKVELVKTLR
jgi:hypothetical protein